MGRIARWVLVGLMVAGCRNSVPPGAAGASATAMGHWTAWRDLTPLIEVAESHAPKNTTAALKEASKLIASGKAKSADRRLAEAANTSGRLWIAVARADLAALHFTKCIRGVAWRLEDGGEASPTDRDVDFSEDSRIEPGDVSVEALLTNLDEALEAEVPALVTQARIARARVAAFAQRCPPNDQVEERAQRIVESDLATLAAEGHLTPDLAYLWAGVQMTRFSGAAARPFLLQAREGGFTHPAVTFMLAIIALEARELEEAKKHATEAAAAYAASGDTQNQAEALYVLGEVARASKQRKAARKHYAAALKKGPLHIPTLLAMTTMTREDKGESDAVEYLHGHLKRFLLDGDLDAGKAREAAHNLEALVILATEPLVAQISRDALIQNIDNEPDAMRRGLRYFYAATLDVRLREYEVAHGHGVLAKEEFAESGVQPPIDVEAFLTKLRAG